MRILIETLSQVKRRSQCSPKTRQKQSSPVGCQEPVTPTRLLAGAWLVANFAGSVFGGQDETDPTFPSPPLTIREASALTNAPTAATATVVPEPALPEVTVPKPAQINIPSATDVQSGPVAPAWRPQPTLPPTTHGLLLRSMQSGPAGPQERLASIAPPPSRASLTNAATPDVAISSSTNSPADQSNIWQRSAPSLGGVDYHW